MAFLFDANTQRYIPLAPHHTVGRLASIVDTHLDRPYISKLHMTIEWRDEHWHVKNLGLNGTYVNGDFLAQGVSRPLVLGDDITLAEPNDPAFKVLDLSPPADMLWPLNDSQVPQPVVLARYHLLPEEENPELTLFLQDQQWYLEPVTGHEEPVTRLLNADDAVTFDNQQWRLIRAQVYGPTEARMQSIDKISQFEFVFDLSLDEESTQLYLQRDQQKFDLGERSHHYLLFLLARHRLEDIARGLACNSQGWVYAEQLALELGVDNTHMNIYIYRARKQLSDILPHAQVQNSLLERRGGKLRIGCDRFKVYKGGEIIEQSPKASSIVQPELSV
ncbi:FHA domain-containing protein [Marinagarivorans cellulosilyticus]|uniref:FHA domain-containing protein n=1 Tax=Marinagarivorans cellulosilyticus TaxID=2721545 RepID=A0AAN2BIK8_9GAMM|nr:FHA domain-containing protein [Marinagarivorans cellulosilyticus]BCD95974.1 hypothetical protein MARGE09_P0173 [Marinagarivorans cellulosilyticus]